MCGGKAIGDFIAQIVSEILRQRAVIGPGGVTVDAGVVRAIFAAHNDRAISNRAMRCALDNGGVQNPI